MSTSLRFTLHKRSIRTPQLHVPASRSTERPRDYHATSGIETDLMDCARSAVRSMIGWICDAHGLSREDAYFLCSLAGDLRIHQIVAPPTYNVGITLPLDVFVS
jgi:acetamidase/formamidase